MLSLCSPLFPLLGLFVGRTVTTAPVDGLTKWAKSEKSPVAWKGTGVESELVVYTSRTSVALSGITRVTEVGGYVGGDTGSQRG